ncbi:DUF3696 domain-containing protein [Candidatus Poribacteria bacterium]|nr:DUF3696 domain-containing protein [Candidatus Poribacteria bacterium]
MLKQTVERPPDWDGVIDFGDDNSLVNLGSFDDLIHGRSHGGPLGISVSWKFSEELSIPEMDRIDTASSNNIFSLRQVLSMARGDEIDTFSFGLSIFNNKNSASVISFSYGVGKQNFAVNWDGQEIRLISGPIKFDYHAESLFRCYGIQSVHYHTQELFSLLQTRFENLFRSIRYLGPLREYPRRRYAWQGEHSRSVGQHGEDMVTALFSGRIQFRDTEEQIPRWLQRLDLIDSYRLNPVLNTERDYEFLVRKYKGGPEVRLTDVGFGVSQILPVLVLCYYVPEGSILILEQPEAHLHPKVQSELADLLIEVVKNRQLQIILESHSEHLLIRLMRRIAEEQISAADTAFYFCEMNEGVSEIERLNVDDYGNITNWPQNFFGDEMGDLAAKAKAEMKRKKANK